MADQRTSDDDGGSDLTLGAPHDPDRLPRRRALWAALAVVALAAGAVVVSSSGSGDGPPPLPVALGGAGAEATATSGAADLSRAWIRYVAGDDLPALGGEGSAYRLEPRVDAGSVRTLAAALGMEGEIEQQDDTWRVVEGDRTLEVHAPSGSWWYATVPPDSPVASDGSTGSGGGSPGCEPGTDCAVAVDPATPTTVPAADCTPTGCAQPDHDPVSDCFEDCATEPSAACDDTGCVTTLTVVGCPPGAECVMPEPVDPGAAPEPVLPEPAADLPTEDEARQIALDLIEATGAEVAGARVTVDGPLDAWYVTVEPTFDGVPVSGWSSSVAVGPKGAVLHAGGLLATAEPLGQYPLIDTRAAVDRLNDLQGAGWDVPVDLGEPGAADGGVTESGVIASGAVEPGVDCAAEVSPEGQADCDARAEQTKPTLAEVCEDGSDGTTRCAIPGEVPPVETTVAPDPGPEPMPMPEPEPVEVVLTQAERTLVLLYAVDGSTDTYLVPGYRMTSDDGAVAEVAAVADESLAPTTVPETTHPSPDETLTTEPASPSTDCEILVEDDGSGTTHTMQTCPGQLPARVVLAEGAVPELGVPYYVDGLNTHCGTFVWADRWWATDEPTPLPWSTPTEGGTFTLSAADEGTFVGDAARTKVAAFTARGPATEMPGCN